MTTERNQMNCVNETGTVSEGVAHGRTGVRCKPSQIVIQRLHQQEQDKDKEELMSFRVCSLNVGTLRGRSSEIVEMLERREVDVCCVQEHRWRGRSVRMIEGKAERYKFFWKGNEFGTGGVGIFLAEKWVDKVIDVNRVSDRIILIKILANDRILTVVSVYAPQCGLDDSVKDNFYDSLIGTTAKLADKEVVVITGDLNGHVGKEAEGFENLHGGFGYGVRNREGERILEFSSAMDMIVGNTFFQKRDTHLVTYESGLSKTQIDYCLVRRTQRKLLKDVKVVPGEECITQHKPLVCDFKIKAKKSIKRKFVPRRKVWKLQDDAVKKDFLEKVVEYRQSCKTASNVDGYWKVLKDSLLAASDDVCGWTKGPPRHKETWWWNDKVDDAVKQKRKLWKEWKQGKIDKNDYLEAKRKAKRAVYQAKCESERKRFGEIERRDDQKNEVFKIAKAMVKTNQDIVGEQCVKNDEGKLAVTNDDKKQAWQSHYQRLLNTEFEWDRNTLSEEHPVSGPAVRVTKKMVEKAVSKMKNGKAAGPSGIVSEMVKAAGEVGIDMITNLVNQIIMEGCIPIDWELSTIVNCYKGKGDALDRGNYRGLKLTDQVLKVLERIIEQLVRQQVDINGMQFGFMPGRGTTDAIFILRQLQEKYLSRNKNLYFAFVDLEKAFDRVPRDVVWWAMRKLGVEEWLIKVVQSLYTNARSQVRINGSFSKDFQVNVGLHQGSVLSPLLFIMVLEALSRDIRMGCPEELLYADDLALISETLQGLTEKLNLWKATMESKGLKVNLGKTKVMVSGRNVGEPKEEGHFPCAICKKGVGSNSIYCKSCKHWVHKRCSGIKGKLASGQEYTCSKCSADCPPEAENVVVNCGGQKIDVVEKFCYLGDTIGARGGAEESVTARIQSAWNKFRELLPLLTSKSFPLLTKGRVYQACVRSVMLYGSETWPIKEDELRKLESNENRMVRWMCGVSIDKRIQSSDLRKRLGIQCIRDEIQRKRLQWFGHLERMDENDWPSKCRRITLDGVLPKGRPKKTWNELVRKDLQEKNITKEVAQDRLAWKSVIRKCPTHACMENGH